MLIDCDTAGGGCISGLYDQAWAFLQQKGGAVKSSAYPYVSGTTKVVSHYFISNSCPSMDTIKIKLKTWLCFTLQQPGTCKFSSAAVGVKVSNYTWTLPYGSASAVAIMTSMSNGAGPMPSAIKIIKSFYYYVYDDKKI